MSQSGKRSPPQLYTLPNMLTISRMIGSPFAILLAYLDANFSLLILLALLVLTEFFDGLLARLLKQQSETGARLDSIADVLFYGSLLVVFLIYKPALIHREFAWIALVLVTYALSEAYGWMKFRQFTSYHTWAAKAAWLIVGYGILAYLLEWSFWPFRIAMLCVALANVEAIAITRRLDTSAFDVASYWHACRRSRTVESTNEASLPVDG